MKKDKEEYIKMAKMGIAYDEIRDVVKADGWPEEEVYWLMREIDDIILERVEEKAAQGNAREWMLVGACIFWVCLIMLLYSFKDPTSHYIYLVYFGLFGGGMIFLAGRRMRG